MKSRAFALVALFLAAGCGGGGGGSAPQAPVTPATSAPSTSNPTATLRFSFPYTAKKTSSKTHPEYVSPNSTQVEVKVNSVNGGAPPSWVNADVITPLDFSGGGNCTVAAGTATCTIAVAAPPGSVNYTFSALDASSNVLATVTTTLLIVQGQSNALNVTLKGVVKTVTVTGSALNANDASLAATGETLSVNAVDASGAQIVNGTNAAAYNNPITLTDNDATGQTALHLNGAAGASSVIVTNPSDVVTLTYTGQAANNFTVAASGTGITGGGTITTTVLDVTFPAGTTLDDGAHGGLPGDTNFGQQTVFFSQASGSQNISSAELGFTNAPFTKQFDITLSAGCAGKATASAGPATTFTITATGAGVCSGRLTEHGTGYPITQHTANVAGSPTHDGTFWISVTTSSIGVN